jgi:hypothetical protein
VLKRKEEGKKNLGSEVHHMIITTNITVNMWLDDGRGIQRSIMLQESYVMGQCMGLLSVLLVETKTSVTNRQYLTFQMLLLLNELHGRKISILREHRLHLLP